MIEKIEWVEVSEDDVRDLPLGSLVKTETLYWTPNRENVKTVKYYQPKSDVVSTKRTFRVPDSLYSRAQDKAEDTGESLSKVVRDALYAYSRGDKFVEWAKEREELKAQEFKRGYDAARAEAEK